MWPGEMKLEPKTAEEVNECATPQGMRKRLNLYSRHNPLVRACYDKAFYSGLSGEDLMTWLAFEALKRVESLEEFHLKFLGNNPPSLVIGADSKNSAMGV